MTLRYEASAATAQTQGIVVQPLGVREPNDFNGAFAAMDRDKPDAILMVADALTALNRKRVFDYAAARRLPAIYESDLFARDGGLMSYGADLHESLTRAASMIDRIFKGARPGDIPFETPTRYLFVINLKTARAMGLEPPMTLLGPRRRCDRVTNAAVRNRRLGDLAHVPIAPCQFGRSVALSPLAVGVTVPRPTWLKAEDVIE